MTRPPKSHAAKAADLKKAGITSGRLKKNYTNQEKGWITRRWNQHEYIIKHPELFTAVYVSSKVAPTIPWAAVKIKVGKKTRLIVSKEADQSVSIKNGLQVFRKKGEEETRYPAGKMMPKTIDKVFGKKLNKHEYVMGRIGASQPFSTVFLSREELYKYLSDWQPKDALDEDETEELQQLNATEKMTRLQKKRHKELTKKIDDMRNELMVDYFSITKVYRDEAWDAPKRKSRK